jgi:hypothetical protein
MTKYLIITSTLQQPKNQSHFQSNVSVLKIDKHINYQTASASIKTFELNESSRFMICHLHAVMANTLQTELKGMSTQKNAL